MDIFIIPEELKSLVSNYDKKDHKLWEDEQNKDVSTFRKKAREHYLLQQKNTCYFCKIYIPSNSGLHWQVEHILPKISFPQFLFEPKNLAIICPDCNREKWDKNPHVDGSKACNRQSYPRTSKRFTIVHPVYDTYTKHLERVPANHCEYPDHHFIRPLTPKGRATVKMCDLNRFHNDFGGYKDMRGKQIQQIDDIINLDLSTATLEQMQQAILNITNEMMNRVS